MAKAKRGKRKRLATGIYADRFGVSIPIRGKEHRYALGTPVEELRTTRRELLNALEVTPTPTRGSLQSAIDAYLDTKPEGPRRRDERALLQHWLDAFGNRQANSIKPIEIAQQLATWATTPSGRKHQPFTPATLKHLRRALGAVYRSLNGRSGYNPVRDVDAIRVRYDDPRNLPPEVIDFVIGTMPDVGRGEKGTAKKAGGAGRPTVNKTKLRLRVMQHTGWSPAMVKLIRPHALNVRTREVNRPQRVKGRGVPSAKIPVTPAAVAALRALFKAKAQGTFDTRALARRWRAAVTRARKQWEQKRRDPWPLPDDARAYDLRHTFGAEVFAATGDLRTTAELLGHSSLDTTRRYTQGAATERARKAIEALVARGHGTVFGSTKNGQQKRLKT